MTVGAKIILDDAPEAFVRGLQKYLELPNKDYWQAIKRNPNARVFLSEYVKYYELSKDKKSIAVGRGCESLIRRIAGRESLRLDAYDGTTKGECTPPVKSSIILREYQEGIAEHALESRSGIFRLDTGFGKTIVALKVIELLQTPTLIVVPRTDIYDQFRSDIKTYFGFEPQGIDEPPERARPIVLATLQTLQRRVGGVGTRTVRNGEDHRERFGCVIVDECHLSVPIKSRRVVEAFKARHRYGFTATARRTDEQGKALEFIYGPIICDRKIERARPSVKTVAFRGYIPVDEYHEIINEQSRNTERNALIAGVVAEEAKAGRKVLVLTKRVEHYELLAEALDVDDGVYALRSDTARKRRTELLKTLRLGEQDFTVLLGTFSLLSTGIDIPSLDTLIIAGDLRSDVLTEQSAGRILRLFEGKPRPQIIDVQDMNNYVLKRQANERVGFYKLNGWDVSPYNANI